jgi:hypothetical protein
MRSTGSRGTPELHFTRKRGGRGEDPERSHRDTGFDADQKDKILVIVDGEDRCAGTQISTPSAVLRALRASA